MFSVCVCHLSRSSQSDQVWTPKKHVKLNSRINFTRQEKLAICDSVLCNWSRIYAFPLVIIEIQNFSIYILSVVSTGLLPKWRCLFYFILFCLFYFVLFCVILLILFCLFYFILLILFCFVFVLFCLFYFVLFCLFYFAYFILFSLFYFVLFLFYFAYFILFYFAYFILLILFYFAYFIILPTFCLTKSSVWYVCISLYVLNTRSKRAPLCVRHVHTSKQK